MKRIKKGKRGRGKKEKGKGDSRGREDYIPTLAV